MNNIILALLFFVSCPVAVLSFELKTGDILFQDGSRTGFDDAVKNVTDGISGYNFSHCGIYFADTSGQFVIEAVFGGVAQTPLDSFLNRHLSSDGKPKVVVGRLVDSLQTLIPAAIKQARVYLGKSYDFAFDFENEQIYCSELVYFAFQKDGKPVFAAQPMTFIDAVSGETQSFWLEYFRNLKQEVPEGKLGINPGGISKSQNIRIVYYYY